MTMTSPQLLNDDAAPRSAGRKGVSGEDWRLVRSIRAGNLDAFSELMRRHNQRLYRMARSVLRNSADAEDAVQETYLKAFSKLHTFRGPDGFVSWISRIALNEAREYARKRRESISLDQVRDGQADEKDSRILKSLKSQQPDPERLTMNSEFRLLLECALDSLPEDFRVVFVMRVVEGLSIQETAQLLSMPAATVRTRLHRARQQLKEFLGATLEDLMPVAHRFDGERCDRIVRVVRLRLEQKHGDPPV